MLIALAVIILIISDCIAYVAISEAGRERWEGIVMFMGRKGRRFLDLLLIVGPLLFIASAIYIGLKAWIVCAIAVPLVLIFGPRFSSLVLRYVIYPIYKIYGLFFRSDE
ncbi:hypothetical protein ES703_27635 [subsurface metagenome]